MTKILASLALKLLLPRQGSVVVVMVILLLIRSGGFFYMGDVNDNLNQPNGAIMVISDFISNVMLLAAESERGSLFYNSK